MLDDVFDPISRSSRPRASGVTAIIDTGAGVAHMSDLLDSCADFVDMVKLGWGTSGITKNLRDKLDMYADHGVDVCFGGTLFEVCWVRGRTDEYRRWLESLGVTTVEVSDGTVVMPAEEKCRHIAEFSKDFSVLSEVGSKDSTTVVAPARWVASIKAELDAGAGRVILEGRETGTSGLYRQNSEMRTGLVDEVLMSGVGAEQLSFEAPQKVHQSYLIDLLGPEVNLSNIAVHDVIPLETLRRGLRSDTLLKFHPPADA